MKLFIANSNCFLYDGEAFSVVFPGDPWEFEVLDFHKPLVNLLKAGSIVIDQEEVITIQKGIVKVSAEAVTALVH